MASTLQKATPNPDLGPLPGESYHYDHCINGTQLRILKLLPSKDPSVRIKCKLSPFTRKNCIPYEALSYCWGDAEPKATILVNGLPFQVGPSLAAALAHLRPDNSERDLWVDAICIDQGNTTERNSQVPKMDRVYGQASSVCVWVGEADDSSGLALSFIRDQILKKIWEFDEICANKKYTASWAALINLMSRRWFSRVSPSIWRSR